MALEHFETAWVAFMKNWKTLVGSALVLMVILYIFLVIGAMIIIGPFLLSGMQGDPISEVGIGAIAIGILLMFLGFLLYMIYLTSFIHVCNKSLKGKSSIKMMFDEARYRWKTFLAINILLFLISLLLYSPAILMIILFFATMDISFILLAAVLFLISIFVMFLFMFSQFSVVIDNVGAVTGIRRSVRFVKANYIETLKVIFLMLILSMGISIVLAFIPLGGLFSSLFLLPYIYLVYVSYYTSGMKPIKKVHKKKR